MTAEVRYHKVLLEPMQGDPEHYSFGSEIADLSEASIRRGDRLLPYDAQLAIKDLQQKVQQLLDSPHESDRIATETTNNIFDDKDMPPFIMDMGHSLDEYDGGAILPWITTASPRDVALLAIWNKARRDHLQTRINEDTDSLQQYTRDSASYLMDSGIYPAGVDELHEMAFEY